MLRMCVNMQSFSLKHCTVFQFVSPIIKANMYVLIKENEALVIDPHENSEMMALLDKNQVKEVKVLLTHEHPDHTCGIPALKKKYSQQLICQQKCAEFIADKRNNRPILIAFILAAQDEKNDTHTEQEFLKSVKEYECNADIVFDKTLNYDWHNEHFVFYHIPGHSQGSCCIVMNDEVVFTGDSLLADYSVITRFPGGNTKDYKNISLPLLGSLNPDLLVLPGHGKSEKLEKILKDTL